MTRTTALPSILSELPLARRLLAPLREVQEKAWGEPLPPIEFPVGAFVTNTMPREEAWALFRELRGDERLANVAVVVATLEAELLADWSWEKNCEKAQECLAVKASPSVPHARALAWAESTTGRRALERTSKKKRVQKKTASEIAWMTSLRDAYATNDTQRAYVFDVEPWQAPLAATWLLGLEGWSKRVATMRRWHDAYGFGVVALSADMLEAYVSKPPANEDELARAVVEAATFCSGFLEEIQPLADMLMGHAWAFRFDI